MDSCYLLFPQYGFQYRNLRLIMLIYLKLLFFKIEIHKNFRKLRELYNLDPLLTIKKIMVFFCLLALGLCPLIIETMSLRVSNEFTYLTSVPSLYLSWQVPIWLTNTAKHQLLITTCSKWLRVLNLLKPDVDQSSHVNAVFSACQWTKCSEFPRCPWLTI